jgi:hypothetical protein
MRMSYDPGADAFYLSPAEMPHGAARRSEEVAPATAGNRAGLLRPGRKPPGDRGVRGRRAGRVDLSPLVTKGFTFEEVRREDWT